MKPYSLDLRQRIVKAVKHEKDTPLQTAERFSVGISTVYSFLQLDRDLGNLNPLFSTGRKRVIPQDQEPLLLEQLNANNDATLEEHVQIWKSITKIQVSLTTMHRALERLRITRKKNVDRN